ncbi:TetR/AcrR family transcriptional regulator [Streptomyces sp. KAU_LT]|uniref:TetR/AcrR family transcriptional regulator n=1 Tax=Streptomyces sp. KAU_LT TaxID=3046669 RepID=UPI0024B7E82B|nr:TetR/AcrR family transcriptional regulator [Streptomyces sp. KAU_LT]MDI9834969.1 TetR/AcrR family transcriptional regulator [Streptomyces sp. KAU_LT]
MSSMRRTAAPRQERLSREVIADSAIALADVEGLEAVTIRRLAKQHNVTPTALYWHFKEKDQLLDGMAERLFANVELPPEDSSPWAQQLSAVLAAFLAALRPHPAVAPLLSSRVLASPAGLALTERTLSLLRLGNLPADRTAEVGGYLLSAVIALVTAEPGREHPSDEEAREDAVRAKRASLTALSPRRYPTVVWCADALADCVSPDEYYAFNLDMLVGGVTSMTHRTAPSEARTASTPHAD